MAIIDNIFSSPGYPRFKRFCLMMSAVCIVVGLALKYLAHNPLGTEALVMGFGVFALFAFLMAYEKPKGLPEEEEETDSQTAEMRNIWQSRAMLLFTQKIWGWGLAVLSIGLLFWLNHWPGGILMFPLGLFFTVIALALKLMIKSRREG